MAHRPYAMSKRWLRYTIAALVLVLPSACADNDVREWTASDHDQPVGQAPQVAARAPSEPSDGAPDDGLVELAWQRSCSKCHGTNGRGDGPEGPMVKAPDLTRIAWQSEVSDEEIGRIIRQGRNKMPAFDLPPSVIQGLVARIRARRAP